MNLRVYWQFYKALFPFIGGFGFLALTFFGALWGYLLFCTVGLLCGSIGFQSFRKNEYYTYYNLGYTKARLFKGAFVINLMVGLPIFLIFLSLFLIIFGHTSIT